MKKWLALVLAFILKIAAATACSDESADKSLSKADIGINKPAEKASIKFSIPSFVIGYPDRKQSLEGKIKRVFNKVSDKTLNDINIEVQLDLYDTHANPNETLVWNGKYIRNTDAMVVSGHVKYLAQMDYVMDLTDLLPEYAPHLYSQFTSEELEEVTYNGRIYAIPSHHMGSQRVCVVVRKDFMEEFGMTEIKDFDDYEFYLSKAKAKNPDLLAYSTIPDMAIFLQSYGYAPFPQGMKEPFDFVYKWEDSNLKLETWELTEAYNSAFAIMADWQKKGYVKSIQYGTNEDSYHANYSPINMKDANQVIYLTNYGIVSSLISDWDTALKFVRIMNGSTEFEIYPLDMEKMAPMTPAASPAIVINKDSQNAENVLRFLDWLASSQENYDIFMYGEKGKDYELQGEKVMLKFKDTNYYGWYGCEAFINDAYDRDFVIDAQCNHKNYSPETDPNLKRLPTAGFYPLRNDTLNDYIYKGNMLEKAMFTGFVSNVGGRNRNMLSTRDISEALKIVKDKVSNDYAMQAIRKDLQEQLDRWREAVSK